MALSHEIENAFDGEWRQSLRCAWWWLSADGRIATTAGRAPRLLGGGIRSKYHSVMRRLDGRVRNYMVHSLVCEVFHGPRPDGCEVRHLDGDRRNNAAINLAWGTRKENHADKVRHGTAPRGEQNPAARLNLEQVARMREMRQTSNMTYLALAQVFGVNKSTAHRAVKELSWR